MKTELPRESKNGYLVLPEEFTASGWTFKQLRRENNKAIYIKTKGNGLESFEVIRISKHETYEIAGNSIPAAECYPSNEQWGDLGWSYNDIKEANKKFNKL
jgi:hypothetical protein